MIEMDKECFKRETRMVKNIPFISNSYHEIDWEGGVIAFFEFAVEKPANGHAPSILDKETVGIFFNSDYPFTCPDVFVQGRFPYVPHQLVYNIPKMGIYKAICLSRTSKADWWCGKTLFDLLYAIKDWLDDATAGNLVKSDDPFEPLIADFTLPPVELDVTRAINECSKHAGFWKTTAQKYVVAETARFVVGSGNIETLVWHQAEEQSTPWIKRPRNADDLAELFKSIGYEKDRFLYWVNKGSDNAKWAGEKIVVAGIRRPKSVLGRPDSEEWVAFIMSQNKKMDNWNVAIHLVHASFNQELAQKLSGMTGSSASTKKALIIGVGSIGSVVADILIKSGCFSLIVLDHDRLQPHNLSRHILDHNALGMKKAIVLEKRYSEMFRSSSICRGIDRDVLTYSSEEFINEVNDVDIIIDCSASIAVLRYLSSISGLYKPIMSTYQINKGLSTLLLYSPSAVDIPLNLVESIAISKWRNNASIKTWLSESIKTVDIGGGCRSANAQIPYSHILFGAASVGTTILLWLKGDKFPGKGEAHIYQLQKLYGADPNLFINGISSITRMSGGWRIIISSDVQQRLEDLANNNPKSETGGILLGQVDRQRKTLIIVECIESVGEQSECQFRRFPAQLKYKLAKIEKLTAEILHYVGEWHSHPKKCSCQMSSTDKATMQELAKLLIGDRLPALCAISNGEDSALHIIEG